MGINLDDKYFMIIIIIIVILVAITLTGAYEHFYIKTNDFEDNIIINALKKRIQKYKLYPHDKVLALRPIGIQDEVCDICVYKGNTDETKNVKFGDFIEKPKNQNCPSNTEYMSRCVYKK
jgi:UTP-glucose-1-phosphate uridylyltransferase